VRATFSCASARWRWGVVIGYAPMLVLCALAPGFATAFVESITFYLGQNALNAELPRAVAVERELRRAGRVVGDRRLLRRALLSCCASCSTSGTDSDRAHQTRRAAGARAPDRERFRRRTSSDHHAAVRSDLAHLAQSIPRC
jgi:hypothetical protein